MDRYSLESLDGVGSQFDAIAEVFSDILSRDSEVQVCGHAKSPDQAFDIARRWSMAAGVSRFASATGLDRTGIPNFYCVRPAALNPTNIIASGKGPTTPLAVLSCLFECAERWAAERVTRPVFIATPAQLASSYRHIPIAFRVTGYSHEAMAWILGYDLISQVPCFVPLKKVIFPYPQDLPQAPFLHGSTTGLAAGTNPIEAICSGILEIVERIALTTLSATSVLPIDLSSLPNPPARLIDAFKNSGVDVALSFVNAGTVPVAYCLTRDDYFSVNYFFCSGSGAHVDPIIAITRALTEAAQSRVTFISGIRDDIAPKLAPLVSSTYEKRREALDAWFSRSPATNGQAFSSPSQPTTFRNMLSTLLDFFTTRVKASILACYPLFTENGVFVARVYCPDVEDRI